MEQRSPGHHLAPIALVAVAALVLASSAGATDYYLSESVGDDAWSGLLPDPNGSMTDGPKRSLGAAARRCSTLSSLPAIACCCVAATPGAATSRSP